MKTKHQYIYQILVLLSCLLTASWAQAATFNINFFDNANKIVGNGQFSFIDGSEVTVCVIGDCEPVPGGPVINGFEATFKNPLTSFTANVDGVNYRGNGWWASGSQAPGQLGLFDIENVWLIQSVGVEGILLFFNAANDTSGSGTWNKAICAAGCGPLGNDDGTFTVSQVETPIPAAVWLFASGLGMLGVFNRKRQ